MSDIIGFDSGTMNLVLAKNKTEDQIEISSIRNNFILISPEDLALNEISNSKLDYIELLDENGNSNKIAIVGEDCFRLSAIFKQTPRRCMSKGVISNSDIDAIDVITGMCNKLIGEKEHGSDRSICTFSIPAMAVDQDLPSIDYHEKVFKKIFKSLGYKKVYSLNEAQALVYSELADSNFTGITISFGSGMTNTCYCYKGVPVLSFSIGMGGDWIDQSAAKSLGLLPNLVTLVKEKGIDLLDSSKGVPSEKRIRDGIIFYYESLIEKFIQYFVEEFNKNSQGISTDEKINLVISGGTSSPSHFGTVFKNILEENDNFPFQINEIRRSKDVLNSVAKGCLIHSHFMQQKKDA